MASTKYEDECTYNREGSMSDDVHIELIQEAQKAQYILDLLQDEEILNSIRYPVDLVL